MTIPFTNYGGAGPTLHFLHANGYPPACYTPLFSELGRNYHVRAMHLRPLWPESQPESIQDWHPLSDDLLRYLDEQNESKALVVGHSVGGITALRAALKAPQRFSALVLIDPVLFPPYFIISWNILRMLGLGHKAHPLIAIAQKRRRKFDDLEKVFDGYRRRSIFRYFNDQSLWAFIRGITRPAADGGFELIFSPEWETRIYYTGVYRDLELWRNLPKLKVPTLIVRGAETDTFYESTGRRAEKANPLIQVETIQKSTHLVPLEKPQEVYQLIHSFLEK